MAQKISHQTYIRMQGLASVKGMQALNSLIKEWLKEGFEEDDIENFLSQRVEEAQSGFDGKEREKLMNEYAKACGYNHPPYSWSLTDYTVREWKNLIEQAAI